jgi:hypothetical protein
LNVRRPAGRPTHDIHRCWLPCRDTKVRLRVFHEDGIQLHTRTCKDCGREWTFATDRRSHGGDGWSTGISAKLGRPTMAAVDEVFLNRREDGWLDANNRHEMLRLSRQIQAGLHSAAPIADS